MLLIHFLLKDLLEIYCPKTDKLPLQMPWYFILDQMRYLPEGKCVTYTVFQAVLILYKMRTLISCIPERYLYQDVFACVILVAELGVKAKAWSKNLQTRAHLFSIKGFLSINEATSFSLISTSNDGLMYRQCLDCDQCMKLSFVNTQASNCVI